MGIGDASGMFPIDQATLDYDARHLAAFGELVDEALPSLQDLLPKVRVAGEDAGTLNDNGARLLGLSPGIPVAAAEGDQPAALAGSLIGEAGMVSMSFGTSVCANSVGDRNFEGVSSAIDHFCAVDGKPINMVFLRNGTTYMNTLVRMLGECLSAGENAFAEIMPKVVSAPPDCGGVLALPFMDDEPGMGVPQGGSALLVGLNPENASAGNVAKAALLATVFNSRLGSEALDAQGYPRTEIVLSGGLTKTPELGQMIADALRTPVRLLASADEGTAWGAALLAKFRFDSMHASTTPTWTQFLADQGSHDGANSASASFDVDESRAKAYDTVYQRYRDLLQNHLGWGIRLV